MGRATRRKKRLFLYGAVAATAVLLLTWAVEQAYVSHLHRQAPQVQQRRVQAAERQIIQRFGAMQTAMVRRAEALVSDTVVAAALSGRLDAGPLVRKMARERLPVRWSVAVYDRAGTLVAWDGINLPVTNDVDYGQEQASWGLATDGDWRKALELWYPISSAAGVLGQVRVLQLLYARTPVQNEYLQDYEIGKVWGQLAGLPVATFFGTSEAPGAHALTALDGAVVGYYALEVPRLEQMDADARQRFRDVFCLWVLLIAAAALWRGWRWFRARVSWPRLAMIALACCVVRVALLRLNVPGRWQTGKAPLSPLFDATHLASIFGGGLMRTTGDFLLSALFFLVLALVLLHFAHRRHPDGQFWRDLAQSRERLLGTGAALLSGVGLVVLLGVVARHAVLDSTVDYLSREALLPEPLTLMIFCALSITALSVILLITALLRLAQGTVKVHAPTRIRVASATGAGLLVAAAVVVADVRFAVPWVVTATFLGTSGAAAFLRVGSSLSWLSLRNVLLGTLVTSTLLYPLFYSGLSQRRHSRMEHAAVSFDRGVDPSIAFAVRDLLETARTDTTLAAALRAKDANALQAAVMHLQHGTLLASRGAFDVEVRFFDATHGEIRLAANDTSGSAVPLAVLARRAGASGTLVVPDPALPLGRAYVGVTEVSQRSQPAGWILVRAAPQVLPEQASTPLLRILLSSGYRDLLANLSIASFRDGLLDHSIGRSFRHFALEPAVVALLEDTAAVWRLDAYGDRRYEAYYQRRSAGHVIGVRAATLSLFDHLFYLLQLILAGLLVGMPFYLAGLILRRASQLLPARRVRFQDKMLNAFLIMAIIAVIPVGIVGVGVVTEENTKALQSWLRNHLYRVEVALAAESRSGEAAYRVLERTSIDSLAARVGLDLNLYDGHRLLASSRSRLAQERLTEELLPIEAYEALFLDGYKFTAVAQQLGDFSYTAGYHALLDQEGKPRYVLAVPTLPEQERIEEERARTLAYLFGALLALMTLVMLTASLLASALARPIARLQQGLKAVARGRHERRLPVQTRDEVGQLAQTFNDMQRQLAESRRQLTQQERQLAWREMARQVAHEIKNPLTPMKLSVQHLQRAYSGRQPGDEARFGRLFRRITGTLVKEMDALAHIANEFASFARLPDRIVEHLDLLGVIREAATLMQAEASAHIAFEVQLPDEPMIVHADRKELKRIYINLIKNALEAMREEPEGAITIMARREEGFVYSAVRDTGCGIAPALQDKIFEPSFSTKTSGAGLGLAIARRSIEASGGEIGFQSGESSGTVFYIRLPLTS